MNITDIVSPREEFRVKTFKLSGNDTEAIAKLLQANKDKIQKQKELEAQLRNND